MKTTINSLQSNSVDKFYYRRHLPHYQPSEATYFVTFRLAGSLPAEAIEQLRYDRERVKKRIEEIDNRKTRTDEWMEFNDDYFARFDRLLDKNETGPLWLIDPQIASIVKKSIHHRDQKEYGLLSYCIMPNHVHMVFEINTTNQVEESAVNDVGRNDIPTYNSPPLFRIMQSLKRYTAREANRILIRNGAFWQNESYDHVVRDDNDLSRIVDYILMNPVSAGLVDFYENWPWSYLKKL